MAAKLTVVPKTPVLPIMDPNAIQQQIGNRLYEIKELPIARLKRFKKVWLEFFADLTTLLQHGDLTNDSVSTALFGLLEDKPGELLEIIIPNFDSATLEDEENGATIPQLTLALDTAITVNGLDLLRKAVPFLMQVGEQALKLKVIQMVMPSTDEDTEKTS